MLHYWLIVHSRKSFSLSWSLICICISLCKFPEGAVTSGLESCGFDPEPTLVLLKGSGNLRSASDLSEKPKVIVYLIDKRINQPCTPVIQPVNQGYTRDEATLFHRNFQLKIFPALWMDVYFYIYVLKGKIKPTIRIRS